MVGEVVGVKELQRRLDRIEASMQPKLVARSIRSAMVPMMRQARANAPRGNKAHRTHKGRLVAPGFLRRNIKLKKMKFRDKGRVGYSLAARGEAWYGRLLETGFTHKGGPGKTKSGRQTKVRGTAWLGRAERSLGDSVDRDFRRQLLKRLEKAKK